MLIALIDGGIDTELCGDLHLKYDLIICEDGAIRPRGPDERVLTDHGTTCAQIIHKYAPATELSSLCIFHDHTCRTSVTKLAAALNWCRENRVPIIHMSVGTTMLCDNTFIRRIVSHILRQGQIIIAAHSNQPQRYTMPACYSGVLGVAADPALQGPDFRITDALDPCGVQIFASSRHNLSEYPGGCEETVVSNSYAAPVITAQVHELLSQTGVGQISIPAIYSKLANRPVSIARLHPDFLTVAIVFDPGCKLKEPGYIGFELLGYYTDESEFLIAIKDDLRSPIVLVTSDSFSPAFLDALFDHSSERLGILYAGTSPVSFRQKAPCIFWDESVYQTLAMHLSAQLMDSDIAVVQIKPQGEGALHLLSRLKTLFTDEKYGCIAISDYPRAYLYGLEYLPKGCPPDVLLAYLCYTHQPDIVLLSSNDENVRIPVNMLITLEGDNATTYSKDAVTMPANPASGDIEKLFMYLLED